MTPRQSWIAYKTILIREVLRFARIWIQTILPPMITTALYFVVFGNLIGERIGEMDGFTYMEYIVPGLILMAVITNSYANVVSSFYGAKFQHHIEEMLVSPMPAWIIVTGFVSGGIVRGMIVGLGVALVSMLFADISPASITVTLTIALLTSALFSLAGLINGVFARSFDDISIVPTFVLTPLTYLGGIFYSINLLPEFWRQASLLNPILYMINGFRYGMLGVSDINWLLSYAIIIAFTVTLYLVCLHLLRTGRGVRG